MVFYSFIFLFKRISNSNLSSGNTGLKSFDKYFVFFPHIGHIPLSIWLTIWIIGVLHWLHQYISIGRSSIVLSPQTGHISSLVSMLQFLHHTLLLTSALCSIKLCWKSLPFDYSTVISFNLRKSLFLFNPVHQTTVLHLKYSIFCSSCLLI